MEYMLCYHEPRSDLARRTDPAAAAAYWGAWKAYISAIRDSGITVSGNGLEPPETGVMVRVRDGKRQVQDGPFADAREHLGGYFIIRVDSLEQALEWAARAPCSSSGGTEVRAVMQNPPDLPAR